MRDRIYFWLEDNCLAVKLGGWQFGLSKSSDGVRLSNRWYGIDIANIPTLKDFMWTLNCIYMNREVRGYGSLSNKKYRTSYKVKIKPDMEVRYQSILRQLRPDPENNEYLKRDEHYYAA